MSRNKVAVLITVYKGDTLTNFISAIDSIIMQSYGFEYINIYLYVDGDIHQDINSYINDSGVFYRIVRGEYNRGLAYGLNVLISNLDEEMFVFRMDSDDVSEINRFENQVNYLLSNSHVDIVGGSIAEFEGDISNITFIRRYKIHHDEIVMSSVKASPFAHVTVCFRKSALLLLNQYPTDYELNEDIAMWIKAIRHKLILGNVPEILVRVRMDGAYSRRKTLKVIGEIKLYLQAISISCCYFSGITHLLIRVLARLLPSKFIGFFYKSRIRTFFVK